MAEKIGCQSKQATKQNQDHYSIEPTLACSQTSIGSGATWERSRIRKQIKSKLKQVKVLTCSSEDAAAAAGGGVTVAAEASTLLFFTRNLVKVFGAAAAGLGAFDAFSFNASGPEFTDLADPDFCFFRGGASSSPSSSLKIQRHHHYRHKGKHRIVNKAK